ncbi:MAG: hypothetical protein J7623_28205 [Chitinophaga sp.]|uniref:hypothetical protein n=1 Tax=Chitinophaga sp. TaxID=1869181 RepID=UPI001B2510A7|nr:hypothetical protein [Chitinophaga sp.]MBO9732559.1 hypothetical protein [Chitinophaga sp.]
MGHRTYLIKSSPDASVVLFEANNSLPFFWLTLIREKHLEQAESAMRERYAAIQEADDDNFPAGYSNIRINRQEAITNGEATYPFLEKFYPATLPLFRDFIAFLDKNTTSPEVLELDIFALSGFNGIDFFLEDLQDDLRAQEMNEGEKVSGYFSYHDLTSLTGYGAFPGSNAGKYHYKPVQQPRHAPVLKAPATKPSIPGSIGIILIGIASLYIPYRGYQKEGITFTVIFCLLLALGVMYMGFKRLVAAISK